MDSTHTLPGYVGEAQSCNAWCAFQFWSENKTHHLAYASVDLHGGIALAVRVFDIYAAVVSVTKDAARYLAGRDADTMAPLFFT
jgi:hypothetical protein